MSETVVFSVPAPYGDEVVEVYGQPENGWYEWRIVKAGLVTHDSESMGYGNSSIALRDGLIFASD